MRPIYNLMNGDFVAYTLLVTREGIPTIIEEADLSSKMPRQIDLKVEKHSLHKNAINGNFVLCFRARKQFGGIGSTPRRLCP